MSTRHGGGGAIVNVSSLAARTGSPGEHGLRRLEGGAGHPDGGAGAGGGRGGHLRHCVRPGFIYTDTPAAAESAASIASRRSSRCAAPGREEVAHAILWLLSGEASFTTGTFIDVAGGR
ncbi:MAG: SDR family oxidoreductase [Vicinamibacterales bacterium]